MFNVCISRVRGPKDNYIAAGEWPSALDINLQRLNPSVIEAEVFELGIRVMSMKTIAKLAVDSGLVYGESWTLKEYEILLDTELALQADFSSTIPLIQKFIFEKLGKSYSVEDLTHVMSKIDKTTGKVLREKLPYLSDAEYKRLCDHKKRKKRKVR